MSLVSPAVSPAYREIINRRRRSNRRLSLNLIAFLMPVFAILASFIIQDVYPFAGNQTIMSVDCYHQYVPFLVEFRNKVLSGESLFYSWNSGLGMEYYAAFANYCSSPLNIFALFFDAKTMPIFIALATMLRAGLASMFMSMFLCGEDQGHKDIVTVAFSCAYALCGWFCTDYWNIMWCDALVLLPLIILGLRKMLFENDYALYVISLGVCILSNYYTGYFVCLFLVLFAPTYYIMTCTSKAEVAELVASGEDPETELAAPVLSAVGFCKAALKFIAGSLLAGGISAVISVPTYLILQNTSAVGAEFPFEYELTGNLFDFLGRFMVAANPNIRDGMANVYTGIMPILLVVLFFFASNKSGIKLRHKVGYGILLLVMYLSFTNRMLNFIWHGFHFPNQIPYRESFLMSFLVVVIAMKAIRNLRSFKSETLVLVFTCAAAFLVLYEKLGTGNESYIQVWLSFIFLLIACITLKVIHAYKNPHKYYYKEILVGVMMLETFVSCVVTMAFVRDNEGYPNYDTYVTGYEEVQLLDEQLRNSEGHALFERMEILPNNVCCIQSLYNVNGISIFSSTARESFVKYMRNFGFHNNGINAVRSAGYTRVTMTLLGTRSIAQINQVHQYPFLFEETMREGVVAICDNEDALSVGYVVDRAILDFNPEEADDNCFVDTNNWIRSMGINGDVYVPVNMSSEATTNATISASMSNSFNVSPVNNSNSVEFTITIDDAQIGADLYVFVGANTSGNVEISENGIVARTAPLRSNQIVSLGVYNGQPIEAKFTYYATLNNNVRVYSYQLDREVYDTMVSELSSHQLTVTNYDSDTLEGTITCDEDSLLFLSIPYSEGFTALVDGKETELISIHDAFSALELTSGTHEIILEYRPAHFGLAVAITIASICTLALIVVVTYFSRKKKLAKEIESASELVNLESDGALESEETNVVTETIEAEDEASDASSEETLVEDSSVVEESETEGDANHDE